MRFTQLKLNTWCWRSSHIFQRIFELFEKCLIETSHGINYDGLSEQKTFQECIIEVKEVE